MKYILILFSPASSYFISLRPENSHQHAGLKNLQSTFFPYDERAQVSIKVSYLSIFTDRRWEDKKLS